MISECRTVGLILCVVASPLRLNAADPAEAAFEKEVRPLLIAECQRCHGPNKQQGGLRLDGRAYLLKGGESGPAIVPGDPAKSLLVKVVRREGDVAMPPDKKLTAAQIDALAAWIKAGAKWPETDGPGAAGLRQGPPTDKEKRFWSFQPVKEPKVPQVRDTNWPRNDIDRFVLDAQERAGVKPGAGADKRTLIRRVTLDLTGLPPTPEEIAAYLGDDSRGAFDKLVDRLLASPAYGERWGRHWLDVVRYADTAGDGADYPIREAYKYRDYVIASFNADKPFDQFVREQIAGDIYAKERADAGKISPERYAELVTATGYLAITKRYGYDDKPDFQHLDLADTIDNLGPTFLGLSVGCARCHDHKFDPVTAADYYALYGILRSSRFAFPGGEELKRPRNLLPLVLPDEVKKRDQEKRAELARLDEEIKRLEKEIAAGKSATPDPGAAIDPKALQGRVQEVRRKRDRLAEQPPYPVAYGVSEGTPADARVQKRGEPDRLGEVVPRRFLELLGGNKIVRPETSGRRDLADWLTRPSNPLTARVLVNRVWMHHFGRGIVTTPNDFGTRGDAPSHPELLDFLAARFVANGWSMKWLHRQIVTSRSYQLAVSDDPDNRAKDPENRLLWQFRRRPLDAESLRDGMLAISGKLVRGSPGPHPFPDVHTWGFTIHDPFQAVYETDRRSVYVMVQRFRRHPFLGSFDGADPNASTPERKPTTTPLQSLYFMNNEFVHTASDAFAGRLLAAGKTDADRVRLAYESITGRPPEDKEARAAADFLKAYATRSGERPALAALARVLFSSNRYLYVD